MRDRLRELQEYIEGVRSARRDRPAGLPAPAKSAAKPGARAEKRPRPAPAPAAQALSRRRVDPWGVPMPARPAGAPTRGRGKRTSARAAARAGAAASASARGTPKWFGVGLGGIDYRVAGAVPVLQQISPRTCWATVTSMMLSWKESASIAPRDAAGRGGKRFLDLFDADHVLPNSERAAFFGAVGLTEEPPMNHTIESWEQMLRSYGPLYVSTGNVDNPETHARVVVGIHGDGTADGTTVEVIDPATGTQGPERFSQFLAGYQAIPQSKGPTRTQVAHWPAGARPVSASQSVSRPGAHRPLRGLGQSWEEARSRRSSGFGGPPAGAQPPAPQPVQNNLHVSDAGLQFIATFEGLSPRLYNDPAGHCTIGYGHLVHRGNCDGSEPEEFRAGITRERALELLRTDAASAEQAVNSAVTVALNQNQFDALVSFTFNVGNQALRDSTLLRELNAGRYDAVPEQMNRWVKAGGATLPGLVRRRAAEGSLFRDGTY